MAIQRTIPYMENGFIGWVNEESQEMELQFPVFKNLEETVRFSNENNVVKLRIGELAWKKGNLDDLKFFPNVREVTLSVSVIKDFTGLKYLPNLTRLSLADNVKEKLDLSIIPKIKTFSYWHKKNIIENLEACTSIENLSISGFNPRTFDRTIPLIPSLKFLELHKYVPESSNLEPIPPFPNLLKLSITESRIASLIGIKKFQNLENILLYGLSKLRYLNDIGDLKKLKKILIENAKKIENHEVLSGCTALENLRLINCGEVKKLDWVTDLLNLKELVLSKSSIKSNDLSALAIRNWDYIYFDEKKEYSHRLEEIRNRK